MTEEDNHGDGDARPAATRDRIPVASEKELEIIRECLFEALWFRSVPMASTTAATVFYLIRRGKRSLSRSFLASHWLLKFYSSHQLLSTQGCVGVVVTLC